MAVSKRIRFEVLRRDNFSCRYCGAKAPDVELQVDHVMPVALGGTDEPSNLVAACGPCNSGKGSTGLNAEQVAEVERDAIRWMKARAIAVDEVRVEDATVADEFTAFYIEWTKWDSTAARLPDTAEATFNNWLSAGLTLDDILEAHGIALANRSISVFKVWRYMCGILRNKIARINARTEQILSEGGGV